jgi:hypothetical protein
VEEEMKLEPETLTVRAGPPVVAVLGVSELRDGVGLLGGLDEPPEPPPQPAVHAIQAMEMRKSETAPMALAEERKGFDRSKRAHAADAVLGAERLIPIPHHTFRFLLRKLECGRSLAVEILNLPKLVNPQPWWRFIAEGNARGLESLVQQPGCPAISASTRLAQLSVVR